MEPGTVSVHALSSGYLTLPERFFCTPPDSPDARRTVPSLAFLIQHQTPTLPSASSQKQKQKPTRILFDLGLRRDISLYSEPIRKHAATREPVSTDPDVLTSLRVGGLDAGDVDIVVLSHVHWDHIGCPADFSDVGTEFVVGNGALGLLDGTRPLMNGSHSFFEEGLLPLARTTELSLAGSEDQSAAGEDGRKDGLNLTEWKPKSVFPHTIDVFNDGSCFIVDAPGHLPGHINLLCRTAADPPKYVYLAGDACHDERLLTGEKKIAEWEDPHIPGVVCCIHADKEQAESTTRRIWLAGSGGVEELGEVEVVFAHNPVWDEDAKRKGKFWPGKL